MILQNVSIAKRNPWDQPEDIKNRSYRVLPRFRLFKPKKKLRIRNSSPNPNAYP